MLDVNLPLIQLSYLAGHVEDRLLAILSQIRIGLT